MLSSTFFLHYPCVLLGPLTSMVWWWVWHICRFVLNRSQSPCVQLQQQDCFNCPCTRIPSTLHANDHLSKRPTLAEIKIFAKILSTVTHLTIKLYLQISYSNCFDLREFKFLFILELLFARVLAKSQHKLFMPSCKHVKTLSDDIIILRADSVVSTTNRWDMVLASMSFQSRSGGWMKGCPWYSSSFAVVTKKNFFLNCENIFSDRLD